jgi:hypothetical protein
VIDETALLSTLTSLAADIQAGTTRRHAVVIDLSGILHIDEPVFHRTLVQALAADGKGSATAQAFELAHNRIVLLVDSAMLADHQAVIAGVADVLRQHRRGLMEMRWFDLSDGAEALSEHLRALAEAAVSRDRPEALTAGDSLARFLVIERSLHAVDLSSLVREHLIWQFPDGEAPRALFSEITVALEELERLFDVSLLRSPVLLSRVTELLDRRMLYYLMRDREAHPLPIAVKLHAETVASAEFRKVASDFPAKRHGDLIVQLPWLEWKLAAAKVTAAIASVRHFNMRVALDHVPLAGLDPAALPPVDYLRVPFVDRDGDRIDLDQAAAALAKVGAERCILSRCHTAEAVSLGRQAGFRLLEGRALREAVQSALSGEGTAAPAGTAAPHDRAGVAAAGEPPTAKPGWLQRLFGGQPAAAPKG